MSVYQKKAKVKAKLKDRKPKTKAKNPFDKYFYYTQSVQSPDLDVKFYEETFCSLIGKSPEVLREDFCGTFKICTEWVKLNPKYQAIGIDLDKQPLEYGKTNYLAALKPEQQKRIKIINGNVISTNKPQADIIAAVNFSYFTFKDRYIMLNYFKNIHSSLKRRGIFILDIFGGSDIFDCAEEETEHDDKGFSYFWDQESYNPINNQSMFHIHFKRKGEKKIKNVFTYDWRVWSIPEIRDILHEAGFKHTHVYWEGTDKHGNGDGEFTRTEFTDECCDSFIAYIVGEK